MLEIFPIYIVRERVIEYDIVPVSPTQYIQSWCTNIMIGSVRTYAAQYTIRLIVLHVCLYQMGVWWMAHKQSNPTIGKGERKSGCVATLKQSALQGSVWYTFVDCCLLHEQWENVCVNWCIFVIICSVSCVVSVGGKCLASVVDCACSETPREGKMHSTGSGSLKRW